MALFNYAERNAWIRGRGPRWDKPQSLGDAERRVCESSLSTLHARDHVYSGYTRIYIYIHIQRSVHRINAPPHTRMQRRSSASPPPGNNSKSLVINPSPLPSFPRPLLTRGLSASSTCPCSSFSFVPSAADSSDCCHFRSSFRRVFANGLSRPWLTFFPMTNRYRYRGRKIRFSFFN